MTLSPLRSFKQETAIQLYKDGHSQQRVADLLELPAPTIRRWLVAEGLVAHSTPQDGDKRPLSTFQTVSRDPCPKCGVRGDIGCKHRRNA